MRFNKLDLNQLVVLDALLTERSVGRAAKRLFLSQPATSCALARLREYFEDELLVAVGKTQVLTPLASGLQQPVREVLLQIETITRTQPGFDPATSSRHITIETTDNVMLVFLTDVLQRAARLAPLMRFDLQLLGPRSQEHLDTGRVELLIAPSFATLAGHPVEPLFDESLSCVAWTGNTRLRNGLDLEQYCDAGHVCTQRFGGGREKLDAQIIRSGQIQRRHEVCLPLFGPVAEMVVGTERVATLPTRLAIRMAERLPLRVLPCPVELPLFSQTLQWHRFLERDPALAWLRSLFRESAQAMPSLAELEARREPAPPAPPVPPPPPAAARKSTTPRRGRSAAASSRADAP